MTALSLQSYDINPTISGKVLTHMLDSRGLSLVQASKDCGIPYDAFRKCLKGEVQTVSLDRILKVCYVTEYTIYDYFRFYYEIEQTHIFDNVVYLCGSSACPKQEPAKIADDISEKSSGHLCPNADHVRQHIDELQQGYLDKLSKQYESTVQQLRDQIQQFKDSRQMVKEQHENMVQQLHDQIDQLRCSMEMMKSQYEGTISLLNDRYERSAKHLNGEIDKLEKEKQSYSDQLEKKSKRMRWLLSLFIAENVFLVGLFAYDYINRSVGWIRSLFNYSGSFTVKS